MKLLRLVLACTVLVAFFLIPTSVLAGTEPSPFITLEVLNDINDFGDVIIAKDLVEVSFEVDTAGDPSA